MLRHRPPHPLLCPLRCWWLLFSLARPGSSSVPCPVSSLPPCLAKVGKPSRSKHNALPSGSLQFRALSKEDHGEWECIATNVVTSITASTHLTVIGMGPRQVGGSLGPGDCGWLSPGSPPRTRSLPWVVLAFCGLCVSEMTRGLSWGGLFLMGTGRMHPATP